MQKSEAEPFSMVVNLVDNRVIFGIQFGKSAVIFCEHISQFNFRETKIFTKNIANILNIIFWAKFQPLGLVEASRSGHRCC